MFLPFIVALVVPGVALTGCEIDEDPAISFGCDDFQVLPGECVDATNPLAFTTEVDGMVPGAEIRVSTVIHDSLDGFEVDSDDTGVVDVAVAVDGESVIVTAVGEGRARVRALHPDTGRTLDVLDIDVELIESVEFMFVPRSPAPLTQVAGLAGSTDIVNVAYRSASGRTLRTDGAVEITAEGEVSLGGPREPRISDLLRGLAGAVDGDAHTVTFGQAGAGVLRVTGGGADASLFVRVVDAPDAVALAPMTEAAVDAPVLVFLQADMSTGEPVAGVRGAWSVEPPSAGTLDLRADPASEAMFQASTPGAVTLVVDAAGLTATVDLDVQ